MPRDLFKRKFGMSEDECHAQFKDDGDGPECAECGEFYSAHTGGEGDAGCPDHDEHEDEPTGEYFYPDGTRVEIGQTVYATAAGDRGCCDGGPEVGERGKVMDIVPDEDADGCGPIDVKFERKGPWRTVPEKLSLVNPKAVAAYKVGDRVRLIARGDYGGDKRSGPKLHEAGTVTKVYRWADAGESYAEKWPGEQLLEVKFEEYGHWALNSGRIEPATAADDLMGMPEVEGEEAHMAPAAEAQKAVGPTGTAPEIVRGGRQIILPDGMTLKDGIAWLERRAKEEQTPVAISHVFKGRYIVDALVAFHGAMADLFNWVDNVPTPGFFGPEPPTMVTVRTGPAPTDIVQVPWGGLAVPGIKGRLQVGMFQAKKGGQPFLALGGEVIQGHKGKVLEIIQRTEERLVSQSLYKGKAIKASWAWERNGDGFNFETSPPSFLDVSAADESGLVFGAEVQASIEHGLFYPLEYTQACRDNGVPLKRGVLLEGPYGVGKTLTAFVAFKKAIRNGWTAIYLDSVSDLRRGLEFAATLGVPCIVFAEDIERVAGLDRDDEANEVINCLDGIDTKHNEIIVVLTSNHQDQINKALRRQGRIDTKVTIRPPDAQAAKRLLLLYGRGLIAKDANVDKVAEAVAAKAMIPAAIREVVERSKVAAIGRQRGGSILGRVTGEDLLQAVKALESHMEWLAEDIAKPTRTNIMVPITVIQEQAQLEA